MFRTTPRDKPTLRDKVLLVAKLAAGIRRDSKILADPSIPVLLGCHLGLGDQVCIAKALERWAEGGRRVVMPVWEHNMKTVSEIFAYLPKLELISMRAEFRDIPELVRQLEQTAGELKCEFVEGGYSRLSAMSWLFPERGLINLLSLCLLVNLESPVSDRLRSHVLKLNKSVKPQHPYAFVDHWPGTPREIPGDVLSACSAKGLQLVHNPREQPFLELAQLMAEAEELHLVPSAPLCLAIVLGVSPKGGAWLHGAGWRLFDDDPGNIWTEISTNDPAHLGPKSLYRPRSQVVEKVCRGLGTSFFLRYVADAS